MEHSSLAGFSATYDPPGATAAADVGLMKEGYKLSWQYAKKLLDESDAYGEMVIDGIYRGISNLFIEGVGLEYKAGILNALNPYSAFAPTGNSGISPGTISVLDTDTAGILIMTAASSTPAAAAPTTLTATYAILAENFNIDLLFDSRLREVPFRFRIYPYNSSGIKFVTTT